MHSDEREKIIRLLFHELTSKFFWGRYHLMSVTVVLLSAFSNWYIHLSNIEKFISLIGFLGLPCLIFFFKFFYFVYGKNDNKQKFQVIRASNWRRKGCYLLELANRFKGNY